MMRPIFVTGFAFAALVAASACSSILGVSDRSLEWCLRPGNTHDFCEDFDHANPTSAWTLVPAIMSGSTRTFVPADVDAPNAQAMDTFVGPLATGGQSLNGIARSFTDEPFDRVEVGLDVRILQATFSQDGDLVTGDGFLLVSDAPATTGLPECIGFVIAPATGAGQVSIGVLLVPGSSDCFTVDNTQGDSGATPGDLSDADAPSMTPTAAPSILTNVFLGQWFRLTLTVTRNSGDGSGTIDFRVPSGSSNAPPSIPAGALAEGYPTIAIGTDVTGPSGTFDIQFDNVTVDFSTPAH